MSAAFDTDVVVAGAGAAGLACALLAAQNGASVVLLEASEMYRLGSNTAMSTSMVPAGGSRWQQEVGIDDSPQRFYEDVMKKTAGTADPTVTAALTGVAPELVAWMADECGVPLGLVTDFRYPGHSRDRCHAVPDRSGRALHDALLHALDADAVTLANPLQLAGVELQADAIVAARTTTPDGTEEVIRTPVVVLATNGFAADPGLVERYIPEIGHGVYFGGDRSRGDALRIGQAIGADVGYLDAYQGHGSLATPHNILVTWAVVMHGGILVNAEGRRFGDESVGYSEYAVPVLEQPEGTAWVVFDRRIDRQCTVFRDYQDLAEAKAIRWADSVEALAARIHCEPGNLAATLAAAASAAESATADEFGRTAWEEPLEPPYAAVKVTGALFHTQGGLRVDEHARVLRGGVPVTGLYAAGGAAVGMSGNGASGYMAGNGLLAALGLGFLAGRHITAGRA